MTGIVVGVACAALLGWLAATTTQPPLVCTTSAVYQSGVATQTPITCEEQP
jgi:ribose/xylose/arabinose/galactoside ABC-type transport system permease subunit